MIRVIPKNTQISATIWKGLTLGDFIVGGMCCGLLALVAFSDIPQRFLVTLILFVLLGSLFIPFDGARVWNNVTAILAFIFVKKKYSEHFVRQLLPYNSIRSDGLILYPNYFAKVLSIGQLSFSLLDGITQDNKIACFEQVFKLLDLSASLDIVKIDRPFIFDKLSASLLEKIEKEVDPVKSDVLLSRLGLVDKMNAKDKIYASSFYIVFYNTVEKNLLETVRCAKGYLQACKLNCNELSDKETVNFLRYSYTRFFDEREIENIDPKDYIEYITPKEIKFSSRGYNIDGINAFTLALSDFPITVGNAWGASIFGTDNTKVVLKVRPVEQSKATKRIDKVVTELSSRTDNFKRASELIVNASHMDTMISTLRSLQNEDQMLFDCSLTVTAFNNESENISTFRKSLRHALSTGGFKTTLLASRQVQGFLSSNISPIRALKRFERGINSSSLAAVFPFVATSLIDEPNGIVLGYNNYPVALDISKRDIDHTNGNCLILGKSGSGKSYATKTIISNLYSDSWKVFILDVENEFSALCSSVGGSKIDIGSATHGRINPFHIYGLLTDDGAVASPESVFNNHLNALESFFKITLDGVASDTLEYINSLVVETYKACGITEKTDCSRLPSDKFPIFDDLRKTIKKKITDPREKRNPLSIENLQRADIYIKKFSTGGRYSTIWNGKSTLESNAEFTVFNFQSLLANKNQVVANAQMLLVMRFLEQEVINTRDKNRNSEKLVRTVIVADEAHAFTDPKFPIALDFLYQMAKRIRKYAGSLFFITQNLGDGTANQEVTSKTRAIFSNCQYSFIFNLAPTDIQSLVTLYDNSGGINSVEQSDITNNPRGTCFLISATKERTNVSIVATPIVEKLFIRQDEKKL
ncbi:MAG: DUF87 domain-containing protein [Christensenellaceae bacterium]|jgi:hypothetical protein|nr:DUF87 domain-containing protein [Christensenellaceae bacterium]